MTNLVAPLLSIRVSAQYGRTPVLKDASFEIMPGEMLGLVGQSGSGKSTLALAILGLLGMKQATATGTVQFKGRDLLQLPERAMRNVRGKDIALVLQSPLSSLNPALRIRTQLKEAWRVHPGVGTHDCDAAISAAMGSVSLPSDGEFLARRPGQLSVGQAQRVLIAMAIIHNPALLIADEPTSALDVITQSEILTLFSGLNKRIGMGLLYISHDLPSVACICDRIAILHEGQIVECAATEHIFSSPQHPYTQRLIAALPRHTAAVSIPKSKAAGA